MYFDYLNFWTNKIISKRQFGCRKGISAKDAVVFTSNTIFHNSNNFKKVFNVINHQKLFEKLYKIGILGLLLKIIHNCLSNRKQCVTLNNMKNNFLKVLTGLPQGTIFGPLLLIVMVNELLNILPSLVSHDDTVKFNL